MVADHRQEHAPVQTLPLNMAELPVPEQPRLRKAVIPTTALVSHVYFILAFSFLSFNRQDVNNEIKIKV